jgi:hypothetical protein
MEQSPWEAKSHSASQEIPCLLLKLKFHYHFSQQPAAGPYSVPDASSSHFPILFPYDPF